MRMDNDKGVTVFDEPYSKFEEDALKDKVSLSGVYPWFPNSLLPV